MPDRLRSPRLLGVARLEPLAVIRHAAEPTFATGARERATSTKAHIGKHPPQAVATLAATA